MLIFYFLLIVWRESIVCYVFLWTAILLIDIKNIAIAVDKKMFRKRRINKYLWILWTINEIGNG